MQLPRDRILAGAGFAGDENVRVGFREPAHLADERAHDGALGNEAVFC
jgi:hypothetical protein